MADLSWKRIGPTVINKIGWRTVVSKTFIQPYGLTRDFQTYDAENHVLVDILALTKDNRVIIARQYRPGPEMVMDDLPGGMMDEGEAPEHAAHRELLEETGYRSNNMMLLGTLPRDSFSNSKTNHYLALDCEKVAEQLLETAEFIEVALLNIQDTLAAVRAGKISNPTTLLLAYEQLMSRARDSNE